MQFRLNLSHFLCGFTVLGYSSPMRQLAHVNLRVFLPSLEAWATRQPACSPLVFFLILFAFPVVGVAEVVKITDVRIADRLSNTRVVFDLSSATNHKVFVLKNPDRLVLDIEHCNANGKLNISRVGGTLLKGMRYAQKSNEKLRVVFDLNTTVTPKTFLLAPTEGKDHRLVIDLASTTLVSAATASTTNEKKPKPVLVIREAPASIRDVVIAIDAGHGGKDPGAIGRGGSREKYIVLAIVKRLQKLIAQEKGMRAVLIRDRDTFVPLRGRIKKASNKNADVFISIHADAAVNRKARGSSVYVLSQHGATSEAARILAQRENEVDKIGGVSLEDKDAVLKSVLVDLSQTATIDASVDLAEDILKELSKIGNVSRKRVEQAGFAVLKSPDIPSVLVETAFISNPKEENRLKTSTHQQALAQAIMKGLRHYLKDRAPIGTLLASINSSSTHTIRRGETLSGIAHQYQVRVIDIRRANALKSNVIRIGQVLTIPVSAGT